MNRATGLGLWASWAIGVLAVAIGFDVAAQRGPGQNVLDIKGLLIEKAQDVQLRPYVLTDGGGFRWDMYGGLYVNSGTNNAFSNAMNCNIYINGSGGWSFPGSGSAALNAEGDELQSGPHNLNNVMFTRRVKVYKDAPLARWLTLIENPSDQEISVRLVNYTYNNWGIGAQLTSSGKNQITAEDWAVATQNNVGGNNNVPTTLHIYADAKSKNPRPNVQIQGNTVQIQYEVKVPPRGGIIVCNFMSQARSLDDHAKLMKEFKSAKLMKDLPNAVRKLLWNFAPGGESSVELLRSDTSDCIVRNNSEEDPLFGKITNASFPMKTLFGDLELKSEDVVGMLCQGSNVRAVTTDGQIISGDLAADAVILLQLATGGEPLKFPLGKIKQFSYQISKAKPESTETTGPVMVLRTGDQLQFDPDALTIRFRTRHGLVELRSADMQMITMDNPGNALHRASFVNGSLLGGMLDDAMLSVKLVKPAKTLDIPRDMILSIQYNQEEKVTPYLAAVQLNNGDVLVGRFADEKFTIVTDVGTVPLRPNNIRAMEFVTNQPGRVTATLWDKSVHRGRLEQEELTFQVSPGPAVKLAAGQLAKLEQAVALPPDEIVKKVDALVARLYSESYKDRDAATEELIRMGAQIVPCLMKYTQDKDAEVRQRVGTIIEKLGGNKDKPASGGGGFEQDFEMW